MNIKSDSQKSNCMKFMCVFLFVTTENRKDRTCKIFLNCVLWSDPGRLKVENHSPIVEIDVLAVRGG